MDMIRYFPIQKKKSAGRPGTSQGTDDHFPRKESPCRKMTGRTSTKVTDRAGTPGLGGQTCHDEDAAREPEARVLQNEVSKAKGPIELFDTEPKPEDRPRRVAAPEEGAKIAIAQKARKGVSDALQGGKAAPGLKAERCHLPARELRERRELIVPPPRARAAATGDGSVTACTVYPR